MSVSSVSSSPAPYHAPASKSTALEQQNAEVSKQKIRANEALNNRIQQMESEMGTRVNIAV